MELKRCRWDLARKQGIPAYMVCHDRTLLEIARERPASLDELEGVFGMGPSRIDTWGSALLEVVEHGYNAVASPSSAQKNGPTT